MNRYIGSKQITVKNGVRYCGYCGEKIEENCYDCIADMAAQTVKDSIGFKIVVLSIMSLWIWGLYKIWPWVFVGASKIVSFLT